MICWFAIVAFLGFLRTTEAGYCYETAVRYSTSYRIENHYISCGVFGWARCSQSRTVSYQSRQYYTNKVCCNGYYGSACSSPICTVPCMNGGSCISPQTCLCTTGYALPYCDDINECNSNNGGCSNSCQNTLGSYLCSCPVGFSLEPDGHHCKDDDECLLNTDGCHQRCYNHHGHFSCGCYSGFQLMSDMKTCQDDDECNNGNGGCQDLCTNTQGSYQCSCSVGYHLDVDSHSCNDIDECNNGNGGCQDLCTNTQGSYQCSCSVGYHLDVDSHSCNDVDECNNGNGGCQHQCTNTQGSYQCSCNVGYILNVGSHSCIDIDECNNGNGGCQHQCTNTQGSYQCSCNVGYHLDVDNHSCNDDDECILTYNGGCQDICINIPGSFTCSCRDGSQLKSDGVSCEGSTTSLTVYQRYGLVRKLLPRGCSTISILTCNAGNDFSVLLSSTSPWYQLRSDTSILYTAGIVAVEIDSVSLPISLFGVTVTYISQRYSMTSGHPLYKESEGIQQSTHERPGCISAKFTPAEIDEFNNSKSFQISFFDNTNVILPDWLSLTNNELLTNSKLDSQLLYGGDINNKEWCKGAPVKESHYYHVMQFGEELKLSVYGDMIILPKPSNGEKLCFIVDICQARGTTFFLMLPETLRNFLSEVKLFQTLLADNDVQVFVRGLGFSVNRQIDFHYHKESINVWNGDHYFQYPVFEEANAWLSSDYIIKLGIIEITGNSDIFIGVPSIQNILVATFKEEWNMFFDVSAIADMRLKFKLFGQMFEIVLGEIAGLDIDFYASIGGLQERRLCGKDANPSGLFFAMNISVNPFSQVPLLKDWFFDLDAGVNIFVMKTVDDTLSVLSEDITLLLFEVSTAVYHLIDMTSDFLESQYEFLTDQSINQIKHLNRSFYELSDDLQDLIDIHKLGEPSWSKVSDATRNVWSDSFTVVKKDAQNVLDSLEFNVKVFQQNVTYLYHSQLTSIEQKINEYIQRVTRQYADTFNHLDGYGFRAHVDIMIFDLTIPKVTIEFVYSVGSLGACNKYKEVYKLFENVESARVFGMISKNSQLGNFISIGKDYGLGAAFSIDSPGLFLIQIHARISLLGITGSSELFISNTGIYTIYEINIWNTFLAQLTVSAEIGRSWYDLTFSVRGKFLADSGGDGSFEDSYMDALRKAVNDIGNEANNRLTHAQVGLTSAQNAFTKAQSWLESKKVHFQKANSKFDTAVEGLEAAKRSLENAKEPFRRAIERLNQAQRDVDKLCRIRSCNKICIPGFRIQLCKCCWGVRYPCPKWTSCLFEIPDPICEAKNIACRIIRGIAYTALEAAKIFVRAPMIAMDVAKAAVSVAQFVVDKSRVVLDIAISLVDVAQLGLDAAKGALEIAKASLEGVKFIVKLGLNVFDLIVRIGLQSVVDARNCQFEVVIKTTDLPILAVECEINLFQLGWNKVVLEVNFRRILQSLWQVAKKFISSIISSVVELFGRRKRDVEYMTKHFTYKVMRETRDVDTPIEALNVTINQTIFSATDNSSTDYDYRVSSFRERCSLYLTVYAFINESVSILLEITNDAVSTLKDNGTSSQNDTINTDGLANNMTLDDLGVDLEVARDEYNMTSEELASLMTNLTAEVANDSLIQEISTLSNETKQITDDLTESADNSNTIEIWIQAMENSTGQYFDNGTCSSFIDCVHHAVAVLYDIFYGEDSINTTLVYETITEIETLYLDFFGNETTTVLNINAAAEQILEEMTVLNDSCPFCYTAPTLASPMTNLSVPRGENAYFICDVTGDPEPSLWWFREGEHLTNETNRSLAVRNVTETTGPYRCVAGNVVANLTTQDVYVNIKEHGQKEDESDVNLTIIISVTSSVAAAFVVALSVILVRMYLRNKARNKGFGSFATLNMIRPASAVPQGKTASPHIITVSEMNA